MPPTAVITAATPVSIPGIVCHHEAPSFGSLMANHSLIVESAPTRWIAVLHGLPSALKALGKSATNWEDQWEKYSTGTFPRHLGEFAGCVVLALL